MDTIMEIGTTAAVSVLYKKKSSFIFGISSALFGAFE